ncbi:MAG TPA: hypothetical protein VE961_00315 [Pyrinomonadaceae bacterium]|nr:hypothetical protein [Pyrinomonadaceae bacterium]
MRTKFIGATALVMAVFVCLACGNKGATAIPTNTSATTQNAAGGDLHFKAPDGWTTEKASSSMRVAQYKLPKVEGDKEDASLVLYFFGTNQGGTAQANIDRWIGQMQQPDGSDSKSKAKTDNLTVNGLNVSTVDVTGTYTAEMAPGSGSFHNDDNYRLRAAVIETPKGNYFVKLAGPANTIAHWDQAYSDYLKSFEFK